MNGMKIVYDELKAISRAMIPFLLLCFAVMVFLKCSIWKSAVSLLLGAAYMCFWFMLAGKNAVRSTNFTPEKATQIVRRGYAFRYALTAIFVVCAIKIEFLYTAAMVLPLFFPKVYYLISNIFQRKGG